MDTVLPYTAAWWVDLFCFGWCAVALVMFFVTLARPAIEYTHEDPRTENALNIVRSRSVRAVAWFAVAVTGAVEGYDFRERFQVEGGDVILALLFTAMAFAVAAFVAASWSYRTRGRNVLTLTASLVCLASAAIVTATGLSELHVYDGTANFWFDVAGVISLVLYGLVATLVVSSIVVGVHRSFASKVDQKVLNPLREGSDFARSESHRS